jgi:hypothetical protein
MNENFVPDAGCRRAKPQNLRAVFWIKGDDARSVSWKSDA